MNKLQELIKKLCPDGVEFKRLEECCKILDNQRKPVTKSARIEGEYPYYGANGIQDYVSDYIFDGTFVLVGEDGSVMTQNGNPIVTWAEGKIWVNNHAHIIEEIKDIKLRYLYHYLQTINVKSLIHGNIPKLNQGDFRGLMIAVPPLEVQCEIVHILDDFTLLSAELSAELKARQKQYEYYKNKLLKNYDEIDNCSLCDVSEYSKERISAELLNDDNYIGVDNLLQNKMGKTTSTHTPTTGNSTKYVENDILIGNIRPYLKKIWFSDRIGGTNGDVLAIHITSDNVVPEYLYYILSSDKFFDYDNSNSKGAKMPRGNKEAVMKYRFYLPKKEEQIRIVKLLNNFEKICNNMTLGIPAEIEARQKQYEYYRDKLLSFKELN